MRGANLGADNWYFTLCGVIMCLPNLDHNYINLILQHVIMIVWVIPTTSILCYFSTLSYFVLGSPTHIVVLFFLP